MCGIFGFVGKRERASSIDLNVALKSLHHRGPDDRGTFFGVSTRNPDLACAFAHTRLSILDLSSAGHQPMTTEDGRYTIVYNGEIYNFRELRAELEQLGERFVSSCDTEVVLRAFARWGVQTVERLRGIFAFVVWDRENGSVFLARDRLGVKPLYYTRRADGLAMASEIRTLLATGCAEARFSEQGLRTYFQYGSVYDPQTILANVESLLPGHYGTFDGSSLTIKSYWQPPTATIPTTNYDEALTSIRSGVRDAIATELASDVPLGIFLSGGVDSSAIAALASASGRTLHTFTVTFDEDAYSEAGAAAEVARRYSCEHHQVHMPVDTAVQELGGVLDALDQPSADGVNTYFVAKAARRAGLAVALSGLGGDELFAGYPNFRSFGMLMRAGKIAGPFAQWMSDTFEGQNTRYLKALDALGARGAPGLTYAALRSMFSKQQRRTLTSLDTDFVQNGHDVHSADPLTQFTRFELSHYLRNTLLRDTDVMSMAHSLEVRVPLLDHFLVERAMRVPGHLKLSRVKNKPLLADAANLPQEIVRRPKMGFILPLDEWFRGRLKPQVEELLIGESLDRLPFLNRAAVAALWKTFLDGRQAVSHSRIWCIAALSGWAARHRVTL